MTIGKNEARQTCHAFAPLGRAAKAGTKALNGTSVCRSGVWEPTTGGSKRASDEMVVGFQPCWCTVKGRSLRQECRESYNAAFIARRSSYQRLMIRATSGHATG